MEERKTLLSDEQFKLQEQVYHLSRNLKDKQDRGTLDFSLLVKSRRLSSQILKGHSILIKEMAVLDSECVKLKGSVDFYLKNARQV